MAVSAPAAPADPVAPLVAAARDGDLYAWESIVRRYQEPIFRTTYLLTRTTRIAESATQAAFIRAYRALPSLSTTTAFAPWLFRIAIGEARQQRREAGRVRNDSRPDEPVVGPHLPATPIVSPAAVEAMTPLEREAVLDAFDRLAEEDRLIIATRYLFGLSRDEAAAALSIPSALVEEHLRDALRRLRLRMGVA